MKRSSVRMHLARCVVLSTVAATAGCADALDRASDGVFDLERLPALILVEELRMGGVEDPDYGFSRISSAAVDRDGQIYTYEPHDAQIRVYDRDGVLVRRIGGPGQGPGEFTPGSPLYWGVRGDTVWVVDRSARRLSFFNREGVVLSSAGFAEVLLGQEAGLSHFIEPSAMDRNGLMIGGLPPEVGHPSQLGLEDSIPVPRVRFDASGAVVDTVGWTIHRAWSGRSTVLIEGRMVENPFPLRTEPLIIELSDGHFEVRRSHAEHADADSFVVSKFGPKWEIGYTRTYQFRPAEYAEVPVDFVVWRSVRLAAAGLDSASVRGGGPRVERFLPPIQSFHIGVDDRLWLRREAIAEDKVQWVVLDSDGQPRGIVGLPREGFQIAWSEGDSFLAIERDELDLHWLVRYRLVEG